MKKNTRLDTKGFLLMETLLVSLTVAGILLYMFVQYSRIIDSYNRLSHYNSVEKLYRAGNIKRFLLISDEVSFYSTVDKGSGKPGIYKIGNLNFSTNGVADNPLKQLDVSSAYIVKGNKDLSTVDASFSPFLKTLPDVSEDTYQIIVKYNDGDFVAITLKEGA